MNNATEESYNNISETVWRYMSCEDKNLRIRYGMYILKKLNKLKQEKLEIINFSETLIDKLISAANTIQEQNDWIECLQTAIGDNHEIIYAALTSKKVLEKHKNKKKRE